MMTKGVENLLYECRLKDISLFTFMKRRPSWDLKTVFQYLQGNYKEDRYSLFMRSDM